MALPVTDAWTSGTNQSISAYGPYSELEGGFNVVSGSPGLTVTSGVYNTARRTDETPAADQISSVVITTAQISLNIYAGPAVRLQSGANTSYHVETNGSEFYVSKNVAGSQSVLAGPISQAFAAGDVLLLEVSGVGATVTLRVYKALAASPTSFTQVGSDVTDTAGDRITAAGYLGVFGFGNTSTTPVVGAWTGGNLATGVTVTPDAGAIAYAGEAPSVDLSGVRTPGAGAIVYEGQSPTLALSGINIVGGAVGTNTATLPPFNAGDVAIVFAFRDGSATNPAVPGTFTNITNTTDGTSCSVSAGWRRLQGGDTTVGTWTNASRVSVLVVRGLLSSGTPVGAFAGGAGTTNTLTYPALGTFTDASGASRVARFAGHRSTNQNLEAAPSGFANVSAASAVDGTAETAAHRSNAAVASQSSTNVTLTGTASGWVAISLELLADVVPLTVSPGAGAIAYDGAAPTPAATAHQTTQPDVGAIVYTGATPVAQSGANVTTQPDAGAVAYAGAAPVPAATANHITAPDVGALVYAGAAPSPQVPADHVTTPAAGALAYTGAAPSALRPGQYTALLFPSNGGSPSGFVAMYLGVPALPDIVPLTLIFRIKPTQHAGYNTTFFHGRSDGTFIATQTYFGAHPYPDPPPSGTDHNWEVSIEGQDDQIDETTGVEAPVTYDRWHTQVVQSYHVSAGAQTQIDFYYDLDDGLARLISHTTVGGALSNDANTPRLFFGDAYWSQQNERLSGEFRGLQVYQGILSQSDFLALKNFESDTDVLNYVAANGITSLHYLNLNPTAEDITDKSGNGNDMLWASGTKATTVVLPDVITQPGAGEVVYAGAVPTPIAVANVIRNPGAGAVAYAGATPAPAVTAHHVTAPASGAVAYTGTAPTVAVENNHVTAPSAGAIAYAGAAPAAGVTAHHVTAPAAGAVAYAGAAPTAAVGNHIAVDPGAGAVTYAGSAPTAARTAHVFMSPNFGAVVYAGQVPAPLNGQSKVTQPDAGAVVYAGAVPAPSATGNRTTAPDAGAVVYAGAAPTAAPTMHQWTQPAAGAVAYEGLVPSFGLGNSVAPAAGAIVYQGLAPLFSQTNDQLVVPGAGFIYYTGLVPTFTGAFEGIFSGVGNARIGGLTLGPRGTPGIGGARLIPRGARIGP